MVLQKRHYTVPTLFFLALFLISVIFFFSTRTTLHTTPPIHSDLYLQFQPLSPPPPHPPPPPTLSSPATTQTLDVTDAESHAQPVTEKKETVGDDVPLNVKECDLFAGTWVRDDNYPIYQPGSCPYVDEAYDCKVNGRTDTLYTKWRWKPDACDLPRYSLCCIFIFFLRFLLNRFQVFFLYFRVAYKL